MGEKEGAGRRGERVLLCEGVRGRAGYGVGWGGTCGEREKGGGHAVVGMGTGWGRRTEIRYGSTCSRVGGYIGYITLRKGRERDGGG